MNTATQKTEDESDGSCETVLKGPEGSRNGLFAVAAICVAQTLAMSLWFATTPVIGQLKSALELSANQATWMALAVQTGFIVGALVMSASGLIDAVPPRRLFCCSAVVGATCTLILTALPPGSGLIAIGLRLLTGVCLAAIYSTGLKAAAGWFKNKRGIVMGSLVAGLILGTATPHLLAGIQQHWQTTLAITAGLAVFGAVVMMLFASAGPHQTPSRQFSMGHLRKLLRCRPYLLTVGGYLGHMWELYAYWAWIGMYLGAVAADQGLSPNWVVLATFFVIVVGAVGSVAAGVLADSLGRERIVVISLAISGGCAVLSPVVANGPVWLVVAVLLIWGFFIVSDSAQLSALATDVTNPKDHGTALVLQLALGFAITLLTIAGSEWIALRVGWNQSLVWLAIGPGAGIICMLRLQSYRRAHTSSALN